MTRRLPTLRLVPVAGATWAVAAAAILAPATAGWIASGSWAVAVVAVAAVARAGRRASDGRRSPGAARIPVAGVARRLGMPHRTARVVLAVIVLAAAAAGATAAHVAAAGPGRQSVAELALEGGRAVDVRAEVVGKVERRAGTLAFAARARSVTAGSEVHRVAIDVTVRVAPDDVDRPDLLDVGADVVVRGTASTGRAGDRAALVLWASRGVEVRQAANGAAALTGELRRGLVRAVEDLPGAGAGLVPGLAVGDTSIVTAELDAAMKEASARCFGLPL